MLGVNITSFTVGDLSFWTDQPNNRLRAKNSELARFDDNADVPQAVFADESIHGCIYFQGSEGRNGQGIYYMNLLEGDMVTCYVRFDRADDDLVFWLDGIEEARFPVSMQGGVITFTARENGRYAFTNGNAAGKLKIYRIMREHASWETVKGMCKVLNQKEIMKNSSEDTCSQTGKLVYVNQKNHKEYPVIWEQEIRGKQNNENTDAGLIQKEGRTYKVTIPVHEAGDTYELELRDAEFYVIASETSVRISQCDSKEKVQELHEEAENQRDQNVTIQEVNVQKVSGELVGVDVDAISENAWTQVQLLLNPKLESRYIPKVRVERMQKNAKTKMAWWTYLEQGMQYQITVRGLNDYECMTSEIGKEAEGKCNYRWNTADDNDTSSDICFREKEKYRVHLELCGLTEEEKAGAKVTFTNMNENMTYTFSLEEDMMLRNGIYRVAVQLESQKIQQSDELLEWESSEGKKNYKEQALTSYLQVEDKNVEKKIYFYENVDNETGQRKHEYRPVLLVGELEEFRTIGAAVQYAERMKRRQGQAVVIEIEPGNYEEMLTIAGDEITLRNAAVQPSIELKDAGVNIAENAVRITSYYGHGCRYFCQGPDGKYDTEVLRVNKENGWISKEIAGDISKVNTYWNATVVVTGRDFCAEGIIFENSFNQYISAKESKDVVELLSDNRGGLRPTEVGDTRVQSYSYLERAAAVALVHSAENVVMKNCRFVGRQDVLYGDRGVYARFERCKIMGSIDYIFGGMKARFHQCELILNASDDQQDIAYITAPQTAAGEDGFLMEECYIRSAVPEVENASKRMFNPGYFGRPWSLGTAQAVFSDTMIGWTDVLGEKSSVIAPAGWDSSLSGESERCGENHSIEELTGKEPDYKIRAPWARGRMI
ncbi:MAG: pectinesterase family protein [Lachnospira sp.]|nr:pectinesterase family protein [Lachnospira sp.]